MSGSGRVGVGIIGAGVISEQYLTWMTTFPDLDVRFVADLALDRARAQAEKWGVAGFGTVEQLLADDAIEIVVNLTVPAAHVPVGLQILDAGKHVWAEKPFALDREGGRRLLDRAAELELRIASAPDTVLGRGIQTALRAIDAGRIGRPVSARAVFRSPGHETWHPNPDFYYQPGGGPLLDMGPYFLTALVQALGAVTRVQATATRARAERVIGSGPRQGTVLTVEVDTQISGLLEFAGGATATVEFSFDSALPYAPVLEVLGDAGAMLLPDPNGFDGDTEVFPWGGEPVTLPVAANPGRGTGVLELARAIRADRPERASGALAFHVQDVMLSLGEAAASRTAVEVQSTIEQAPLMSEDWDPTAATL
ncbi:Gfo/Idh/MocA family protein [Homoserinibacter sp. GY 40078]|uniref:Gfo/Idh/MocA family protein n=1 Tax=Homoserinibacter sp. GY 40078 TaxID=2603275 RepID=UPI0011CCDC96|nr:Gfo/Idh/MocA family oxidoreductase [Homoserinibacter sp. GY 40078]TXK18639.1 Gfo/Idh/MocA family oxidoreductase [Homoserinibacter sp. GY 40078]